MTKNLFWMKWVLMIQKRVKSKSPPSQEGLVEYLWLEKVEAQRPCKIGLSKMDWKTTLIMNLTILHLLLHLKNFDHPDIFVQFAGRIASIHA